MKVKEIKLTIKLCCWVKTIKSLGRILKVWAEWLEFTKSLATSISFANIEKNAQKTLKNGQSGQSGQTFTNSFCILFQNILNNKEGLLK